MLCSLEISESPGRFVYGRRYLERADAVALDPVELKLAPRVYETGAMNGVFGALRDASPDDALWVAKFNRPDDKWNTARVEHAMLSLARACGLMTAESRLVTVGDTDVLLVKRFDREKAQKGYFRARMISALTLLRSADTYQSRDRWSYILLAEELRRASAEPKKDAAELFRRMCFNATISNTDDHPRPDCDACRMAASFMSSGSRSWILAVLMVLFPLMSI